MKKITLIGSSVFILLALGGFFLQKDRTGKAKIEIPQTNVQATVFIDDKEVAQETPYEGNFKPGELKLRLVPLKYDKPLGEWETKVILTEGVTTIVRREFGETGDASAGEILSFEKISSKKAQIAIISEPDAARIEFDGQIQGYTPLAITQTTPGEHEITLSHPGYLTRQIGGLKAVSGYKLTVQAVLARDPNYKSTKEEPFEASLSAQPANTISEKTLIEILETGTGFLRVRSLPSTSASESARVSPGKTYPLVEESKDKEWLKIEYEKDKSGWISQEFAKKVAPTEAMNDER